MRSPEVPWCVPDLSGRERGYLAEAVAAGQIGPVGQFLTRFEQEIAYRCGVPHAVATCTGSAAAHICVRLAGVEHGQEVATAAWTFVATGNAIRHAGAHPVALDVEADHWQLDPARLERFLTSHCTPAADGLVNPDTGRRVTAVMPVHLLGHPADLNPIRALADEHGLAVVTDAAQAVGATYRGEPVGSHGLSAVSFNANKLITTGGGGAILTDDAGLAERARYLINQARENPTEYRHGEVGFNYRMTNLQAAVGCAQLERIDTFIAAKRRIFDRYADALAGLNGVRFQTEAEWAHATRWFTTIHLDPDRSATTAIRLRACLAEAGIAAGPPWTPLHLTGAHDRAAPWPCPVAESLGEHAMHLPCSVGLTDAQQDRVSFLLPGADPSMPGVYAGQRRPGRIGLPGQPVPAYSDSGTGCSPPAPEAIWYAPRPPACSSTLDPPPSPCCSSSSTGDGSPGASWTPSSSPISSPTTTPTSFRAPKRWLATPHAAPCWSLTPPPSSGSPPFRPTTPAAWPTWSRSPTPTPKATATANPPSRSVT